MRRWLFFVVLLLLVCCTACSGNVDVKPWGDLQLPGVQKIPGIEMLQKDSDVNRVYHALTYQSAADSGATHVMFAVGQSVYGMRLDGSQLHQIALPCSESLAVAPGGHWLACVTNTDIVIHDLTDHQPDFTLSDTGQFPGYPTWAPDGHHLAVVASLSGGCSVAIFDIVFPSEDAHLTDVLSLPRFASEGPTGPGCSVARLTWSPDGVQLAFIDIDLWAVYDFPIASLHILSQPNTTPTVTRVITGDQLVRLGKCSINSGLAWTASSKSLTFVDALGWNIEQVDIESHDTSTLLAQHAAGVFDLSWTPDGKHLLFVLGLASDELTVPPSQIYIYSPTAT